jgi:peptide/nickel transport system substrate-binding protein
MLRRRPRFVRRAVRAVVLATLALQAPLAIGAEAGAGMAYGETTRLDAFDPYTVHEAAGLRLADLLFDSLVTMDPTGAYRPSVATKWEIAPSRDAVTFTLRDDAFWHRDEATPKRALAAEDVVATVRLVTAAGSEIPNRERFSALAGAERLPDGRVVVRLARAVLDPLRAMTFKILPAASLGATPTLRRDAAFVKQPIGTGPYRFVKATPQGEIVLAANDAYFGGKPKIPQIVMKAYADQNVMAQSLMFDSIDLVTYVSPRDLGEVGGDARLSVLPYDALSFSFVALNTQRGVLKDKRVRQAISAALDRKDMMTAFFQGQGRLVSGPFPPTSWAYNLDVKPVDYDVARAKSLLAAAGLKDGDGDGVLETPAGKPVTLTFAVPLTGESEMVKRIVLAFQSYLDAVGIRTDLQFMDWLVWKKRVLGEHDYDATIASWSFDDATNVTSLFHSSSAKPWGNNFVMFSRPEVDALLTEADVVNDADKRLAIYHKLHAVLAEETPYVYLWSLTHHAAHSARLSGVRVEPFAFFKYILSWRAEGKHGVN